MNGMKRWERKVRLICSDNKIERYVVPEEWEFEPEYELCYQRSRSSFDAPFQSAPYSWNWSHLALRLEKNYSYYGWILAVWNEHPFYRGLAKHGVSKYHYNKAKRI